MYTKGPVPQLYEYMKTHDDLPPARFVDEAGHNKKDTRRTAFVASLAGHQYVDIMAYFVTKSKANPPNSLHIVWTAAKNKKRKDLAQRTIADAFAKKKAHPGKD